MRSSGQVGVLTCDLWLPLQSAARGEKSPGKQASTMMNSPARFAHLKEAPTLACNLGGLRLAGSFSEKVLHNSSTLAVLASPVRMGPSNREQREEVVQKAGKQASLNWRPA